MKTLSFYKNKLFTTASILFSTVGAYAQQKKLDVDIDVNKSSHQQWYTQPWMWVVGGAIFILLLVALLRNGQKS